MYSIMLNPGMSHSTILVSVAKIVIHRISVYHDGSSQYCTNLNNQKMAEVSTAQI